MRERLIGLTVKWPKLTILAVILLTAFFGSQLRFIQAETDANANLPENHPAFIYNDLVEDIFQSKDVMIVSIFDQGPEGVFRPETLALVERLTDRIEEIKGVVEKDVMSLSRIKNIVGMAAGFRVGRFIRELPQNRTETESLIKSFRENDTYVGSILSDDRQATNIFAKIEEGASNRLAVYQAIMALLEAEKDQAPDGVLFYVAGRPVLEVTFGVYMQRSMQKMFPLVILVIVLVLYGIFRSIRGVLLPLFVVIAADVWALGIMALCKVPMYVLSTNMPIILMAIGIADGIHILEKYYQLTGQGGMTDRAGIISETFAEMWTPVVMTSLTTAAGFASLGLNEMVSIRAFGIFTAVGVLAAMVVSLTLLPAALATIKVKAPKRYATVSETDPQGAFGRALAGLAAITGRSGKKIILILGVIFAFSLGGMPFLTNETSWLASLREDSEVRIADKALNSKFDGTIRYNVIFEGSTQYAVQKPAVLRAMAGLQAELARDNTVGGSLSLADFVARMNQVMNEGRDEARVIPKSEDLIAQYLFLYSMSGDPGDFDEYVDYDYKMANAIFFLKTDNTVAVTKVVEKTREYFRKNPLPPGIKVNMAGAAYLGLAWVDSLITGQMWSIASSLAAIFLITSIMFRSFGAGLVSSIPIAGAMLISFGLLALTRQPLDVSTALSSGIIIGIGVDYAIHFISRYRLAVSIDPGPIPATTATMLTSGRAITYNALVVIAGFMVLFASDFRPSWIMGVQVAWGMFICLVMAMTLLPAVLNTARPGFIYNHHQGDQS